jgi:hypothetical protein
MHGSVHMAALPWPVIAITNDGQIDGITNRSALVEHFAHRQ